MKQQQTLSAIVIGFLVGIMIYGVAKNGFGFIYIAIPLLLIYGNVTYAQKQKEAYKLVQSEIRNKRSKNLD